MSGVVQAFAADQALSRDVIGLAVALTQEMSI